MCLKFIKTIKINNSHTFLILKGDEVNLKKCLKKLPPDHDFSLSSNLKQNLCKYYYSKIMSLLYKLRTSYKQCSYTK